MRHITLTLLLASCAVELAEHELAIENGAPASAFQVGRAAQLSRDRVAYCSATQIDADTVVTALHCKPAVGDTVAFWTSATALSPTTRTVAEVSVPPGTWIAWPSGTYDDVDEHGHHADVAVLRLSEPMRRSVATLAWHHPGPFFLGVKVGSGQHEESLEAGVELHQRHDFTYGDDDKGDFWTAEDHSNDGDSGGPLYLGPAMLGVLTGSQYDCEYDVDRQWYTSVPHHLEFILDAMGYQWPFGPLEPGVVRGGDAIETFLYRSLDVCSYACAQTKECVAFSFLDSGSSFTQCTLLSTVTGTENSAAFTSGKK
jgi:hypothetical protein